MAIEICCAGARPIRLSPLPDNLKKRAFSETSRSRPRIACIARIIVSPVTLYGVMTRCLILIGDRQRHTIAPGHLNRPALPGNAFVAIRNTSAIILNSPIQNLTPL